MLAQHDRFCHFFRALVGRRCAQRHVHAVADADSAADILNKLLDEQGKTGPARIVQVTEFDTAGLLGRRMHDHGAGGYGVSGWQIEQQIQLKPLFEFVGNFHQQAAKTQVERLPHQRPIISFDHDRDGQAHPRVLAHRLAHIDRQNLAWYSHEGNDCKPAAVGRLLQLLAQHRFRTSHRVRIRGQLVASQLT